MKRKIFSLTISLLLLFSLALRASADTAYVVDKAGLMTSEEVSALEEKALSLREIYHMDIVIVTNYSLGGKTPEAYADDYFDYNSYGYGDDNSGILFLLSMEERDWYISTCGDGIYTLTDYGIQKVAEEALPYLSSGDYYKAFDTWLDALVPYLEAFQGGEPLDGYADYSGDYYHGTQEEVVYYEKPAVSTWEQFGSMTLTALWQSLILGLVIAAIAVLVMRSQMNTKKSQPAASCYLKPNSYRMSRRQDMFLYSRVTKTRRQESSSSGGGHSGGGSSTHHSSSGSSHGGGGGKF